ncbi:MAG: TetR/AcrR family transcriptional regulator [Spirochaetaceae bacterium]|nr:TetR/AcrR family transcriptional regulator [Spirochaetaceae bacterium]
MTLLTKKSYRQITAADIAKKAGVSRQTFYRMFKDKDDIVCQFLTDAETDGLFSIERISKKECQDTILLTYQNEFMEKNYNFIKNLILDSNSRNVIEQLTQKKTAEIIEHYKSKLTPREYKFFYYKLMFQISGCLAVINDWFDNEMPLSALEILDMINSMASAGTSDTLNLPNIEIRGV